MLIDVQAWEMVNLCSDPDTCIGASAMLPVHFGDRCKACHCKSDEMRRNHLASVAAHRRAKSRQVKSTLTASINGARIDYIICDDVMPEESGQPDPVKVQAAREEALRWWDKR